jgi:hypothetical protein
MKHTYLSTSLFILTSIFTIHYSSAAPAVEQRTTEGSASSRTTEGSASSTPPNIIFILADDWGLGDVKTYGCDR